MLPIYYERPLAHISNGVLIRVEEIAHQLMGLKGNAHLLNCWVRHDNQMNSSPTLLILNGHQLPILLRLIIQCLKVLIGFLSHGFVDSAHPNLFDGLPMCPGLMACKYSLS